MPDDFVADRTRRYLEGMWDVIDSVDPAALERCVETLWKAWEEDRSVFLVGNGGSASTASHMACDLGKQTQVPGRSPLRAHALTDNVELMTAFANDDHYSRVFAEQVNIHARPHDVLICFSCSGQSPNILAAAAEARKRGVTVIGFGGSSRSALQASSDVYVHVASDDFGYIESAHLVLEHCITQLLFDLGKQRANLKPAVLIDRDGVIVRNRHDYVKSLAEMEFIPGAAEALAELSRSGHRVFVATNQSAVGRGIISAAELEEIHRRLEEEVRKHGGTIDGFLVCPHHPDDGCDCRKPLPGLLYQARDRFGVDLGAAYVIGDSEVDMRAAAAAGCSGILVLSGVTASPAAANGHRVARDLPDAAGMIMGRATAGVEPD